MSRFIWTKDLIEKESIKYTTKYEFRLGNNGAYQAAKYRNILDDVCTHMNGNIVWDDEKLKIEALKYNSRSEFFNNSNKAYKAATRHNILDDVCSHMINKNIYWSNEMIKDEALKYNSRSEFKYNCIRGYTAAQHRGILKDICNHMKYKSTGFNPKLPGYVYYIRFDSELNLPIYKIGITNNEDINMRIISMQVNKEYIPTVICAYYFESGYECYEVEKLYHVEFERFKYIGEDILANGNTELFIKDVLELDNRN